MAWCGYNTLSQIRPAERGLSVVSYLPAIPTISRQQSRQLDRRAVEEYGMSGVMLMENAGRATCDVLCGLGIAGPVLIVCGKGNNGGDGFVIARHLDLRGHQVRVLLLDDPTSLRGDAAINHRILSKSGVAIERIAPQTFTAQLSGASWIVDAILGTGASGEPREPYATAIDQINAGGVPILAVDVPSGFDCDTGKPAMHTIRAQHTCTFVAAKPGFLTVPAKTYVGELHLCDIGAPRKLVEEILRG
jgi:NAD(P)H-hydrate epimerase